VTDAIVVDVGNTRIKWGRCAGGRVIDTAGMPYDALQIWQEQADRWAVPPMCPWLVSGVHPTRRDALVGWLRNRHASVRTLDSYRQLPLEVSVAEPEKVGIDRLLNGVAANTRRPAGFAAVIADLGSAVTVDYVDAGGKFGGGAIFPGMRMMAQALHEYTALLPLVAIDRGVLPGKSTDQAIRAGIFNAVAGGIERLVNHYRSFLPDRTLVYVTGGDGLLLTAAEPALGVHWPEMTLEGILHSVPGTAAHG
jgi:type III pantothenate kinase